MQIMRTQKDFAKALKQKILVNIMIRNLKGMYYFKMMFWETLGKCV